MRIPVIAFTSLLISFVPTVLSADDSSVPNGRPVPTSQEGAKATLGFYLFAEETSWQDARLDWKSRALSIPPVLSEADILTYDPASHTMTITAKAFARYTNATFRKLVVPFVVVANGERIYPGSFVSLFCSASIPLPSITDRHIMAENISNKLTIDRNYAAPIQPGESDPRSDERIKRALGDLGKLQ